MTPTPTPMSVQTARPEDEARVAAAHASSSGHHHHHLPTLHGHRLGHSTLRHSPNPDTATSSNNHDGGEASTAHADWMHDVEPWPATFHAGFEPIPDLPGLGGMPAWVGAGALTSAHENGERAGESNGHVPLPGMSHSPSQSDSSYSSGSSTGQSSVSPPLPRTPAPAHTPTPPTHPPRRHQAAAAPKKGGGPCPPSAWRHEGLDERRGVGAHAAHGADLAGECIGEGWVSFICGFQSNHLSFFYDSVSFPLGLSRALLEAEAVEVEVEGDTAPSLRVLRWRCSRRSAVSAGASSGASRASLPHCGFICAHHSMGAPALTSSVALLPAATCVVEDLALAIFGRSSFLISFSLDASITFDFISSSIPPPSHHLLPPESRLHSTPQN
ncbi:hypothetical protein C8R44DRAFT_365572 [Mycena epipterygia]|nr:hypothetical protein C8R44DRAFT_365572 [Mycena epipterygia]